MHKLAANAAASVHTTRQCSLSLFVVLKWRKGKKPSMPQACCVAPVHTMRPTKTTMTSHAYAACATGGRSTARREDDLPPAWGLRLIVYHPWGPSRAVCHLHGSLITSLGLRAVQPLLDKHYGSLTTLTISSVLSPLIGGVKTFPTSLARLPVLTGSDPSY